MTILVTGATGSVGRFVVDGLLARGERVRATTRDPGTANLPARAEVVRADITAPETFLPALQGVDLLYLFPHFERLEYFLAEAKAAGVRRVVTLSSSSTVQRLRTNKEAGDEHLAVEQAVEDTGLEWTHLRPGMFAGNTGEWAETIKEKGIAYGAYPLASMVPIHERDIADVAIAALLENGHEYARYSLTGPEQLTRLDLVRTIGEVLGKEIEFVEQTPEEAKRYLMTELYWPEDVVTMIEGYRAAATQRADEVSDVTERVLGRPALTYRQWMEEHADWFR